MLYFLPTPIGNLDDISKRCLDVLELCEIIICEDTRVTKSLITLLNAKFNLQISPKEFYSLHTHNEKDFFDKFDKSKLETRICVYASDAGMPCISDPGISLVKFAQQNSIKYEVLSGANALLLAAAASGIIEKEFIFLGFLPNLGKERQIAIQNALNSLYPVIIYESPKRILSLIEDIVKLSPDREIFAIKEATKKFETKFKDNATNLLTILKKSNLNGEWCVVVDRSFVSAFERISQADILALDIPPKQKAKLLCKITGENSKKIYQNLIK
ncbi:16S rRNA (cytidine(1402)-2'-O)-methyltransferase [Campylobacter hyointestinalis subsp. lawsonii CCUG 27631]|uniref:16S rRNA (cytidine(1402)-2'-O)-methyltransferase n=1 Tax=Campylobacter hyointestinalis TaxID=198 RepID=UPI0007C966DE|nr:16S rRNA (cytidine(1402)-2'-O)-methyltransferase [Campylobacter hyointestinalis]ANE33810.1 16S rRNA (cytidine(1402)-2'-O)-methyltransferase [Campylobacter hyointestinalis subsp. lawsonii CCUG 27631]